MIKNNYKIVIELPSEIRTRHSADLTVATFTSFVYGRKDADSALRAFGSAENLRKLRKQGLVITRTEFNKCRSMFHIEQV